jgi:uncharacterized membrane protein YqjE
VFEFACLYIKNPTKLKNNTKRIIKIVVRLVNTSLKLCNVPPVFEKGEL